MILYMIEGLGVFSAETAPLPVKIDVQPAPRAILLDGRPTSAAGGRCVVPANLLPGIHTLMVDGQSVTFQVSGGQMVTAQCNWRCLLPTILKLLRLEKHVTNLEKSLDDREVNWLK